MDWNHLRSSLKVLRLHRNSHGACFLSTDASSWILFYSWVDTFFTDTSMRLMSAYWMTMTMTPTWHPNYCSRWATSRRRLRERFPYTLSRQDDLPSPSGTHAVFYPLHILPWTLSPGFQFGSLSASSSCLYRCSGLCFTIRRPLSFMTKVLRVWWNQNSLHALLHCLFIFGRLKKTEIAASVSKTSVRPVAFDPSAVTASEKIEID